MKNGYEWVCSLVWNTYLSQQSRPDCFDSNQWALLADLTYLATIDPDGFWAAVEDNTCQCTQELVCEFQRKGQSQKLWDFLREPRLVPLLCDISKYEEYRQEGRSTKENETE